MSYTAFVFFRFLFMRFDLRRLPIVFLSVTLAACSSAPTQEEQAYDYLEAVQPVVESLESESDLFDTLMSETEEIDQVAIGSMMGSLKSSIATLEAVQITDPLLQEANGHLIGGVRGYLETLEWLAQAVKDPVKALAEDFESGIDERIAKADAELERWEELIDSVLPDEELDDEGGTDSLDQ